MASGTVRAAPARSGNQPMHRSPVPGQLCCAPISIQKALHQFAKTTADSHQIDLATPPPVWKVNPDDRRPCVFVGLTEEGIQVLPLSTFQGSEPEGWNLLLQAIAVPIGAKSTIRPLFHDRRAFQSHPAWTHRGGKPTYILPQLVILPPGTVLRRLPVVMMRSVFEDLRMHCTKIGLMMRTTPTDEIQRMIRSFEANPYGDVTWAPRPSAQVEEDRQIHVEVAKHCLNPQAPAFVPRASFIEMMSFPDLANASNCGSTIAFSTPPSSSHAPSIHQVLQENIPLPIGPCNVDSKPRNPPRSFEDDKENVGSL